MEELKYRCTWKVLVLLKYKGFVMKKRNYITLSAAAAVILLAAGCGGGGGATQPSATSGVYTIQVKGGDSNKSNGGNSDYYGVQIRSESAIEVKKGGKVDASFSMPANPYVAHLGDNPEKITADLNISSFENMQQVIDANLSAGTPYLMDGDVYLYVADADDNVSNDKAATSLTIESGATVIIEPNIDSDNADSDNNDSTGADTVAFQLDNDLVINGTLKTKPVEVPAVTLADELGNGADMSALNVYTEGAFIMGKGSLIDTSGEDAVDVNVSMVSADGNTSARGGNGGGVYVNGEYYYDGWAKESADAKSPEARYYYGNSFNLVRIEGTIDVSGGNGLGSGAGGNAGHVGNFRFGYNKGVFLGAGQFIMTSSGKIVANGGNGGQGGSGSIVQISAFNDVYNQGTIDTRGGNGSENRGGQGGYIVMYSYEASLFNSADLVSVGGDGNMSAGSGGQVYLFSDSGALYNSGNIDASGGVSTSESGGDGARIEIYSENGDLKTSGNLISNGGKGEVAGGSGGYISIYKYVRDEVHADTNLEVSGNLHVNGGDSVTKSGGSAGQVYIRYRLYAADYGKLAIGGVLKLLGYDSIDVSGGNGATYGENGGNVLMDIYTGDEGTYAAPLYLVNEADIIARGGRSMDDTMSSSRNYGGYINMNMGNFHKDYESGLGTSQSYLNNSGNIDVSSSDAVRGSGNAGSVEFESVGKLTNSGSVTGAGGDVNGTDSHAGRGAFVGMVATNDIANSGNMVLTGGNGEGNNSRGGDGGALQIYSLMQASNSGDIIVNGGNSNGDVDNSDGGVGAISSSNGTSTNSAGSVNVSAGTGGSGDKGSDGMINVDGVDVTP